MNRAQLLDKNSELFEKALRSDPDKAKEYNKLKKAGDESEVYTFKTKLYSELFMKDLYGNLLLCPRSDSNKSLFFEFTNIDKRALEIFETAVDYTEGLTRNPGPRPKPSFYSVKI